jgi:hypothetical protein
MLLKALVTGPTGTSEEYLSEDQLEPVIDRDASSYMR